MPVHMAIIPAQITNFLQHTVHLKFHCLESCRVARAVWVPAEEVCWRLEPMPVGCPEGVALLGPGTTGDVGTTVPAVGGATWVELVVVLVVAVVGKVGPPCGKALHAPEAR
ncbi:hypothetical protein NDU88_002147 [Pleurodeles waltl]|uniref:Uncharacterized protein n=1 Tax=Pleurodeles waltl TaxID=8319 RepID=A0AAV7SC36_PLEWA|nr:hypothetical protein NDU88_002147 [Pleurodeles waltl]